MITQHEIIISEDNSNYIEYKTYINNLFSKSTTKTIKENASLLLFTIIEDSTDCLRYIYKFALSLFSNCLNNNHMSQNEFDDIKNINNSVLTYLNNEKHKATDLAVLIIILLSYASNSSSIEYESILKLIKIIEDNCDKLCIVSFPIYLQYKLILFFDRYYLNINFEGKNIHNYCGHQIIKSLIFLNLQNYKILLSKQSEIVLFQFSEKKEISNELAKDVLPLFLQNLVTSNNITFFDLFMKFFKAFGYSDLEKDLEIFRLLNEKIIILVQNKITKK